MQTKIIRKKVKEQMKSNIKWLKKNLWTGEKIRVEEIDKKNKKVVKNMNMFCSERGR